MRDLESNKVDTEWTQGASKLLPSDGETKSDQSLLNVNNLSTSLVVLQVKRLSPPWIGAHLGDPNYREHQVLYPLLLLEVQVMNEIVLHLVKDRDSNGNDGDHVVPGKDSSEVEISGDGNSTGATEEETHTNGVLVLEPSILGSQSLVLGVDSLSDSIDSRLVRIHILEGLELSDLLSFTVDDFHFCREYIEK